MATGLEFDGIARISNSQCIQRRSTSVDDEEELRREVIERVPTYDLLRRGMIRQVLGNDRAVHDEVDVTKLRYHERKRLIESVLKDVEEDNQKLLKRLRERIDR